MIDAMGAYVESLRSGEPATGRGLLASATRVADVITARIVDVRTWRTDIGQPGPATLADALLEVVAATPTADRDALRAGFARVVAAGAPPPTGRRVPDRNLVQGPDGQPASATQIEAGQFQVVSDLEGGRWFIVLDLDAADVAVRQGPGT